MCCSLLSYHLLRCLRIKHISLIQHQVTQSQEEEALSIQQPHHCKWCCHQQLTFINITKKDTATSKQALVLVQIQMKNSTINISSIADKNLQFLWILNFLGSSWSTPSSTLVGWRL